MSFLYFKCASASFFVPVADNAPHFILYMAAHIMLHTACCTFKMLFKFGFTVNVLNNK